MVTLRPGSHVWRLLTVLSAVGEFPAQSLHLLGSERSLEKLVHRLESPHEVRSLEGNVLGSYKLLKIPTHSPGHGLQERDDGWVL